MLYGVSHVTCKCIRPAIGLQIWLKTYIVSLMKRLTPFLIPAWTPYHDTETSQGEKG